MSNPQIDSVVVDSAVTQITVSGSNFKPSTSAPQVRFGGTVLTVTSSSSTSFVASLPSGLSSGSYELEVENSDSFTNTEKFEVDISQSSSESEGFRSGFTIVGNASNLQLSSTPISVPLLGPGINNSGISYALGGDAGAFRIILESVLPSGAGDLHATIKNITTGNTAGYLPVYNGTLSNHYGGSLSYSAGDQLALILSVSGSSVFVRKIQWYID